MPGRLDLNDIRLLMQIVERGSYTAASRATGIPKSTISQRIAALERAVGTGLLRRTSRSFSLTEAGSRLLPHARSIDELSRCIERELLEHGPELEGTLRVSCSAMLAQFALASLIPRFLQTNRKAALHVESENRLVDLIGEGFDLAVRGHVGPLKDSTLLQRVVARTPWSLAASPDWVLAHGMPPSPGDLSPDETLCFSASPEYNPWRLSLGDEECTVTLCPRLVSDDMVMLRDSAVAGAGVACLPTYLLASALRAGQLVKVLPDWTPTPSMLSVLTPPRLQSSRLAQAFSDFLAIEVPRAVRG